jgi:hypothetical protein
MKNGSVFIPVPWLGYTFFGGILGASLHHKPHIAFSWWLPLGIAALGFGLSQWSYNGMQFAYWLTGWESFHSMIAYHHLYWRLGHVLIVVSIFMGMIPLFKRIPKLITKIGSETLTIYSVHYVILYGTWFGIGLSPLFYRSLGPWTVFIGAILFISFFVVMIWKIEPIREQLDVVYDGIKKRVNYFLRVARVVVLRNYLRRLPALQALPRRSFSILKYFL